MNACRLQRLSLESRRRPRCRLRSVTGSWGMTPSGFRPADSPDPKTWLVKDPASPVRCRAVGEAQIGFLGVVSPEFFLAPRRWLIRPRPCAQVHIGKSKTRAQVAPGKTPTLIASPEAGSCRNRRWSNPPRMQATSREERHPTGRQGPSPDTAVPAANASRHRQGLASIVAHHASLHAAFGPVQAKPEGKGTH